MMSFPRLVGLGLAFVAIGVATTVVFSFAPSAPEDRALTPPISGATGAPLPIVAFGTSLSVAALWPAQTAEALSRCLGRPSDAQIVAGIGMGSAWGLDQLERVVAAQPKLVVIEFAINDADLGDGVSLAVSRQQHEALLAELRQALPDADVILMTMNPVRGWRRHLQRPRLGAYYALYRDLAAEYDVGLADIAPRWRADATAMTRLADGLHPDKAQAAALIVPALVAVAAGPNCQAS